MKSLAMGLQMFEVFFGVLPQLWLQLYILGFYGVFDKSFLFCVGAQAVYVIYAIQVEMSSRGYLIFAYLLSGCQHNLDAIFWLI